MGFLLLLLLPQASAPAQQAPPSREEAELKEALRLKESVVALYQQGNYDEALPLAKRALEIEQRLLGPTHERVAVALNNLAQIYLATRLFVEAEPLLQQALAIFQRDETRNTDTIGTLLERLASLRFENKEYSKASALLERSLILRKKASGDEDVKTAETMFELAVSYQFQKQFKKAEALFLQALKTKEKLLGASLPLTVRAMKHFACASLLEPDDKKEKSSAVGEPFDENNALLARAICWLGGMQDNCADAPGNQFGGSQGLVKGKAVSLPRPHFPMEARGGRASGMVIIAVLIDERGRVLDARGVCSASGIFIHAGLAAARGARFSPTLLNGKPIQTTGIISYNFIAQ